MEKTVFCIMGRTASGKSSIVKQVAKDLDMKILKSYTTRDYRKNETPETSDHIHIKPKEVEKYRDDMIAYTDRVEYCNFATKQQLLNCDFYIIDPVGYYELKLKAKDMDINFVVIYITIPYQTNVERAKKRGDYDSWKANYDKEDESFREFEQSTMIDYRVLNNKSLEEAVEKMKHVIKRSKEKCI